MNSYDLSEEKLLREQIDQDEDIAKEEAAETMKEASELIDEQMDPKSESKSGGPIRGSFNLNFTIDSFLKNANFFKISRNGSNKV